MLNEVNYISTSISDSQISRRFRMSTEPSCLVSTFRILSSSCWGRARSRPGSTGAAPPCSPPCRAASRALPPRPSGPAAPAWTSAPAGRRRGRSWGRWWGGLTGMRSLELGTWLRPVSLLDLDKPTLWRPITRLLLDNLTGNVSKSLNKSSQSGCNWEFYLTESQR